jgi:hypothetical protein
VLLVAVMLIKQDGIGSLVTRTVMPSWSGGKGDRTRPPSVDSKTFDSNWDRIFGHKENSNEENRQGKTEASTNEENKEKPESQGPDL